MRVHPRLASWALVAWVAAAGPRGATATEPAAGTAAATVTVRPQLQGPAVGAGRCSAMACHGSARPIYGRRTLGNESDVWESRDPHARAYSTLHSEWSRSIARALGRGAAAEVPAHEDGRCLACHSLKESAATRDLASTIRQDGVSCEACHGTAGAWLALHSASEWAGLTPEEKQRRFGMTRLDDLTVRARRCVGCHVGEGAGPGRPAREVDHDLIAAGHPRLNFEFAAFLANLPAHWREHGRNAAADFPARAWAIGQVVSAQAAAELLESRAREAVVLANAGRPTPWPEFAEYECSSCHQDLRIEPAHRDSPARGPVPGVAAWGTWYYPLIDPAIAPAAAGSSSCVARLRALMEAPSPPADLVSGAAHEAAVALSRWLAVVELQPLDRPAVDVLIDAVRRRERTPNQSSARSWDAATQEYLALVPLRQALPEGSRDGRGLGQELLRRRTRITAPFPTVDPARRGSGGSVPVWPGH